jgi:nitroreductase
MELLEGIRTRRAIRKFKPDPVPPELIEKILEAAHWAPSSVNSQPCEYIVVTNAETRARISRAFVFGPFIKNAPLTIVVAADRLKSTLPLQDGAIAAYAIWLAAHGLGLGACWVNPNIQFGIKRILGIPFNKRLVAVMAIGYPNEAPVHGRKNLADSVFFEKHGNKQGPITFKE